MNHRPTATSGFIARDADRHHARLVQEPSFEAAVVAYLEDFDLALGVVGGHEMNIIVYEVETGHEHCFRVDLDTGNATPCG